MKALPLKKLKFVNAFLKNPNATEAAIEAGYAPRTAASAGSRLLKDPEVQDELKYRAARTAETAEVDAAWVLKKLKLEAESCAESGPRIKALELLGKHLHLFSDRLELTGKDGAPLQASISIKGPR